MSFFSLSELLEFFEPPDGTDPRDTVRWRFNTSIALMILSWFALWSLTPWGFARTHDIDARIAAAIGDLDEVRAIVRELREESYESRMVEYKALLCHAETADSRRTYLALLREYQRRYAALTEARFEMPDCGEL